MFAGAGAVSFIHGTVVRPSQPFSVFAECKNAVLSLLQHASWHKIISLKGGGGVVSSSLGVTCGMHFTEPQAGVPTSS